LTGSAAGLQDVRLEGKMSEAADSFAMKETAAFL